MRKAPSARVPNTPRHTGRRRSPFGAASAAAASTSQMRARASAPPPRRHTGMVKGLANIASRTWANFSVGSIKPSSWATPSAMACPWVTSWISLPTVVLPRPVTAAT